jgi:hypothetical protein
LLRSGVLAICGSLLRVRRSRIERRSGIILRKHGSRKSKSQQRDEKTLLHKIYLLRNLA